MRAPRTTPKAIPRIPKTGYKKSTPTIIPKLYKTGDKE
jgi:hypothetical protein